MEEHELEGLSGKRRLVVLALLFDELNAFVRIRRFKPNVWVVQILLEELERLQQLLPDENFAGSALLQIFD
ncbi:hypothetical protein I8J29_24570 [Paenibacillus sp. MWE-103]|uniref:Uncharacterized protein n=1 Tax=Paenibacillus artemisiicola TaxID=1172618 RepID=A0ABS3WGB3_9BACL|nr:hypothetical protein [Paenibacillus artemisiicola]MBO7747364.1 hypothetical protein [Paenibacillus artemisiicola]